MGRTSKLAYRFDMILVAIFLMGILVILLYIADKYEYGGGIALIIGGGVIWIGSYYFRDCIRIDTQIKDGMVITKTENIGYWETETTLEKKYEDAFSDRMIKEIQSMAFEIAAEAVYIESSNYDTKKIKHVQNKIPNLWKKIIDWEVLNKRDMKDLKKAIYEYQEELGRALALGEWNESFFNQWLPKSISKHSKPGQPSLSVKASNVKSEADKL
ncbi:hypothetical protein [Phocaeicola salanitronis]|uniref:hypothetical protein n=1 Tax=Phocaeicola salanitronis TaxID=376805 RepID=UPI0025A44609|nr:hypothetical protein [Phocaeicola salanitronis]MDM8306588.1 hypothetical protein [Phocaeicola salanitronis]